MNHERWLKQIQTCAQADITAEDQHAAEQILRDKKVAIFIVAYNAEKHLESVIRRIPSNLMPLFAEVFVIDDSSNDSTYSIAGTLINQFPDCNLKVYRTPFNRGYGGNQKLGYLYCVENKYDIVILLHGDGQYPPEYIPRVLAAFADSPDAVFASRMLKKKDALKGGMPLYKWAGNQILTAFENKLLGAHLSEFHTGFRAYNVASLESIPFSFNSDDFHFDTEIIIQAIAKRWKILEVPIPTRYADEKCHVNGWRYALNCTKAVIKYRLVRLGLYYQRNFDLNLFDVDNYQFKRSKNSLHQFVLSQGDFGPNMVSLELGANRGILSDRIAAKVGRHIAVDIQEPDLTSNSETFVMDLNAQFSMALPVEEVDRCVALDVVEHMNEPELFLSEVFQLMKPHGILYVSTANICYLPVRFSLLLGQFNYGKRGILDRTHKRLFSVSSFRRLIRQYGFQIEQLRGFPPPLVDLISDRWWMRLIENVHAFLSRVLPNLFAYNFLIVARRMDGIADIFQRTVHNELYEQDARHGAPAAPRVSSEARTARKKLIP